MDIDIECLREAKTENLERLATALGIALPTAKRHNPRAYTRDLVRAVLRGLQNDRVMHERMLFSASRRASSLSPRLYS